MVGVGDRDSSVIMPQLTKCSYPTADSFDQATNLATVTFAPGNHLIAIGDYAFRGCSGLGAFALPSSTVQLGIGTFSACSNLKRIAIPPNVSTLPASVLQDAAGLESVTFASGSRLTAIGEYAFGYAASLNAVAIPDGVRAIQEDAFGGCFGLTNVTIPHGTSIATDAFEGCGCDQGAYQPGVRLCNCVPSHAACASSGVPRAEISRGHGGT